MSTEGAPLRSARNRTLALAGIFQAAHLVNSIARQGSAETAAFAASVGTIFQLDAPRVEDIYGGLAGVTRGLELLQAHLAGPRNRRDLETARLIATVLHLERKLSRRRPILAELREGIERASEQATHFSRTHENVIANLADTYLRTVSTVRPRILVNGDHVHLAKQENANKIRVLLLAAIRSAVLWRQCGGHNWQLFFGQRSLARECASLLAAIAGEAAPA